MSGGINDVAGVEDRMCELNNQKHHLGSKWHPFLAPKGFDKCVSCSCVVSTVQWLPYLFFFTFSLVEGDIVHDYIVCILYYVLEIERSCHYLQSYSVEYIFVPMFELMPNDLKCDIMIIYVIQDLLFSLNSFTAVGCQL